jgi:hypothetical protein
MKQNRSKMGRHQRQTLADLVATVFQIAHNERLGACVVADMINTRKVRLEGRRRGWRVRVV